jgi:hypothetical protein
VRGRFNEGKLGNFELRELGNWKKGAQKGMSKLSNWEKYGKNTNVE